jgi:hypothetical protein
MGRQDRDQGQLFYEFKLDDVIPKNHLRRRMNVFVTTARGDLHEQLKPFYSEIDRPPPATSSTSPPSCIISRPWRSRYSRTPPRPTVA